MREKIAKRDVCPGCRYDGYNYLGIADDKCIHLTDDNLRYDEIWKRYYCMIGDNDLSIESRETVHRGVKMIMDNNRKLVKA